MTRYYISTLKTNMAKENVSLDIILKKIYETKSYLLDEIKHNDLMSEKHKNVCRSLLFSFFVSAVSDCVSISAQTCVQ